nr:uncharacterized protein zmp:0000001031 isoform X2 [Danio rerio]|eukprot:XP_021336104.1 uncharacterized protein zmp:0000001031 isoform X2 [Danio rerio]
MRFFMSLCVSLLLIHGEISSGQTTVHTTSSFDPCHQYTTLDEYWRNIRIKYYLDHDDTMVEWSGWYRLYLTGQSAQMSEWCMSSMGCGGYTGLYLNGSHPTLEDGVVTRDVVGRNMWSNQCGKYRSSSIRVKACPGDYYVYELVKPDLSIPKPSYCAVVIPSISSDPCYNYEPLDRPWRANNESGDSLCDDSFTWRGWYRLFYYGMDIRMPETCTTGLNCNTYTNLVLDGSHPQIEDGVVIREVCGSSYWSGCCDSKSIPIRVKACPGNYYVYELVRPQMGCSGYCIDVSTISQVVSTASPDIIPGSTITSNYDPCNNYNTLDNDWRSTYTYWPVYNDVNGFDNNYEWDGWYRLLMNGLSAQMPDWCASYMTCGGVTALWLHGSHPRLEDGVVTREVYGSRDNLCSRYRSNPIQVKACAGDYYVYKFTRPPISIQAPRYCAVSFTTPSVDPCYNYTSLDEPWRSTDNPANYYGNHFDWSVAWNGWYRLFYNNQSAQMPDSCVNEGMCGTYYPLWLNGSHPELEDGVVLRQVCVSAWNGCCTFTSHPIRVKACPGDYYVYEFVQPRTHSAYCVATNQSSTAVTTTQPITSEEFINPPTTAPPVDPCNNYFILDDPWRATSNQNSSQLMCDRAVSWSGWYRLFINGQSVQMPDTCVDENSCGTHAPLWLSGGHPTLEDGVVTRDVCGHWSNNCCYFQSNPIQVKACPGGFYVYEFVRPTTCNLAYCADVRFNTSYTTDTPETTTTETTTTISVHTTSSFDPCHQYNTLDEYWRNIRIRHYLDHDDTMVEWNGWYRLYLTGQSAQMSEWCMSSMGCGGYTGLYLNGSHPTLEDGVVTRDVVGRNMWSNQCGKYRSSSIRVKACPGDYYVYELVKPDLSIPKPSYCAVVIPSISSDPCYNYESLDRPWRANNESGDSLCDDSFTWRGWYRLFYFGMDIRMPETCTTGLNCNTYTNLVLDGPHPQIEDGVVTREVCGSSYWSGCCDSKSIPIRVKACPGNYYVYELVRPQMGCSGYCIDVSTISQVVSTASPDIIPGSTITSNYDPCNNYNTLDNDWRSTYTYWPVYNDVNGYDNNYEWDGWYRLFMNGLSAQMPDWCASYMTCGGVTALWLHGSHPRLEDGVVTREVYGSRDNLCSRYRSNPIQVKACPGYYYVYKFTRPPISIQAPRYCAVSFTTPSVDPCYNYTSLDEPWRSTDNPANYYGNHFDWSVAWNGWYRLFYNSQSAQMPDSCVNEGMCGTYYPLWLNGSHPELEDGVVLRQVCVSAWNGCCTFTSHPIRVKACPGDYYVYEFVQPRTHSAYCVATNQSSTAVTTTQPITSEEFINPPTTDPPVDPCNNYIILDEPWRATSNQNSSQLMCDSAVSWSGWYRLFINGQSVQMPDTCVDENSCGTHAPLWLSGGHPTLEDGVVTRDVCGHWGNNCCYFQSNPIQVKACPGGFYVYEFVRPTTCNLAYCADDRNPCSELNCSKEERCGMKNGVYGCLCNKGHHKHRAAQDSFDFNETCESSSGSMSVSRCQLFEAGFSAEHLHLNDPSCRGTVQNGRVEFNFDNDQHICGTNLVANGSHFIYSNYIVGTPGTEGLISRVRILKLSFSCVYPQTQTLSMNVEINPLQSTVHKVLPSGEGVYQVRMVPYVDEEFTQPFTGRVDAELDQEMHVEVGVEGVDSRQFALVMDTCWATPVNDPDYSLRWDLITEGCPNPEDDTVKLLQNGVSTSSRFSFRMFIFTANSTKLYLHCAVHLCLLSSEQCSTSCDSGEQRRERRALDLHDSASLSMGPLVWSGGNTDVQLLPDQVTVSEASCLFASLVLLFIPLMSFFTLS